MFILRRTNYPANHFSVRMEEGTHNQGYCYEGKSPALNLPAITSLLTITNPVSTAAVFPVLTA